MQENSTDKRIKRGRIALVMVVILNLTVLNIIFITKQVQLEEHERTDFRNQFSIGMAYCFGVMSILLFINVVWLNSRLRKQRDLQAQDRYRQDDTFYKKEICSLWLILGVFNVTYLLRALWDIFADSKFETFRGMIIDLNVGILCDFVPVTLLMIYHYKNFRDDELSGSLYGDSIIDKD